MTPEEGASERRKRTGLLSDYVYREIVFNLHSKTGLTGIAAENVEKVMRRARRLKYITSFYVVLGILIFSSQDSLNYSGRNIYLPLETLIWLLMIFVSVAINICLTIPSEGGLGTSLSILPMSGRERNSAVMRGFMRTVDVPFFVALGVVSFAGLVDGPGAALAGVISVLYVLGIFLLLVSLLARVSAFVSLSSRKNFLLRIIAIFSILVLLAAGLLIIRVRPAFSALEMKYVPVINLMGVFDGDLTSLAISLAVLLALMSSAFLMFRRYAADLISPSRLSGMGKKGLKLKYRSQTAALIVVDFRQLLRVPKLAGTLILPFILIVNTLLDITIIGRGGLSDALFFAQDLLPASLAAPYLAYSLYMSELKGYAYFRTLAVSRFQNLAGKLLAASSLYILSIGLMLPILLYYGGGALVTYSAYALIVPVIADVIYMAVNFQHSTERALKGRNPSGNFIINSIVSILIIALPVSAYLVSLKAYGNLLLSSAWLGLVGLAEAALLLILFASGPD